MLLHKHQVYRHLLLNKSQCHVTANKAFYTKNILLRLATLMFLIEICIFYCLMCVDIKWYQQETNHPLPRPPLSSSFSYTYLFVKNVPFLFLCAFFEFLVYSIVITLLLTIFSKEGSRISSDKIREALIISSFGKIIVILMVIWNYYSMGVIKLVNVFVIFSNIEAIYAMTSSGHATYHSRIRQARLKVCISIAFAHACRWLLQLGIWYLFDQSYPISMI